MEYVRGNVDYLTITETEKNLLHVKIKKKLKIMYEVIKYYKSNQSTIHLFIECNVTFSHK